MYAQTTSTIVKVEQDYYFPPLYSDEDLLLRQWNEQQQLEISINDQLDNNSSSLTGAPANFNWEEFHHLPPVVPCSNTDVSYLAFDEFDDICKESGWWWDPNSHQLLDDIVKDIQFPVVVDDKPLNYAVGQVDYQYNENNNRQRINTGSEGSSEIRREEETRMNNNGKSSNKSRSITLEEIQKYFDVPITKAAKELNVGLTVLKKRCRELNIARWPHRKIKSLKSLIDNVKDMGLKKEIAMLEEHKRMLLEIPEMELTERTKKLRQACFKANYKKRKTLAAPV